MILALTTEAVGEVVGVVGQRALVDQAVYTNAHKVALDDPLIAC